MVCRIQRTNFGFILVIRIFSPHFLIRTCREKQRERERERKEEKGFEIRKKQRIKIARPFFCVRT